MGRQWGRNKSKFHASRKKQRNSIVWTYIFEDAMVKCLWFVLACLWKRWLTIATIVEHSEMGHQKVTLFYVKCHFKMNPLFAYPSGGIRRIQIAWTQRS